MATIKTQELIDALTALVASDPAVGTNTVVAVTDDYTKGNSAWVVALVSASPDPDNHVTLSVGPTATAPGFTGAALLAALVALDGPHKAGNLYIAMSDATNTYKTRDIASYQASGLINPFNTMPVTDRLVIRGRAGAPGVAAPPTPPPTPSLPPPPAPQSSPPPIPTPLGGTAPRDP